MVPGPSRDLSGVFQTVFMISVFDFPICSKYDFWLTKNKVIMDFYFHANTHRCRKMCFRNNGELYEHHGGNMVDGLQPAFSFGSKNKFPNFILRFFGSANLFWL